MSSTRVYLRGVYFSSLLGTDTETVYPVTFDDGFLSSLVSPWEFMYIIPLVSVSHSFSPE